MNKGIKNLTIGIIAGSLALIAVAVFYSLVVNPYLDDKPYRECVARAESSAIEKSDKRKISLLEEGDFEAAHKVDPSDYSSSAEYSCYKRYK